jgi:hypothetical protein
MGTGGGERTKMTRQDEESRERGEERGGPFDANSNTDTYSPVGDGQQQSRKVPIQPTTHEVSKDTASKRDKEDTYVSTATMAVESEGQIVPGDGGKGIGAGKQTPAMPHAQTIERVTPNDSMNSDTSNNTRGDNGTGGLGSNPD